MTLQWWQKEIGYQIYPRSFKDTNNDGLGDLPGIIAKLPYLQHLGIGFICLAPIYPSPNIDNGYDVSDFTAIADSYGTMVDFELLLAELHKKQMHLVMDLVINHTSDQHQWFQQARSSRNNPYHDYYIWRDAKNGVPNNWQSILGGSAWEYNAATDEYYLHLYTKHQPDLNWENPQVRNEIKKIITFWTNKGVDGFHLACAIYIKKLQTFANVDNMDDAYRDVDGIEVFLDELTATFHKLNVAVIGGAMNLAPAHAQKWFGNHGYFDLMFQFEHTALWQDTQRSQLSIPALKQILVRWQNTFVKYGWNALFTENHDLPRSVSIYGSDRHYWLESAKCLAACYFLMRGTPFIYQGQELGMTNAHFNNINEFRDAETIAIYHQKIAAGMQPNEALAYIDRYSRDNARTPMQWNHTSKAGFTQGQPWININTNAAAINVTDQLNDESSIFNFYRTLIHLRKQHPVLINGAFRLIDTNEPSVYAYYRWNAAECFIVVANLSHKTAEFSFPEQFNHDLKRLVLGNYVFHSEFMVAYEKNLLLQPYEVAIYQMMPAAKYTL
ncbi:MAG: alpha-glucosidase [Candidatus Paralactobacillus gallistercoris]|uniref:Alpha-glucosidase n=1 Tax=Candidatus Paralactobacillus gallistercoris TaxID=2838724 RepID=A0A948TJU8_9LACO|nr:alpha-glucosidase [Candidatus Paralactobacillus gallistercoris]